MNPIEELLKLIGDGAELSVISEKANAVKTSYEALDKANKDLTANFEEAKQGRDKTKSKYRDFEKLVKESLGLEEITAEAISEKLKSGNDDIDAMREKFEKDLQVKNSLLEKEQELRRSVETEHKQKMKEFILETEAQKAISATPNLVKNPFILETFKRELLKDVELTEDGKVVPMEYHNGTKIPMTKDTKALGLLDKALLMSENEDYKTAFFNNSVKDGDGGVGSNSFSGVAKRSEMTAEQKTEYRQQHGDRAFLSLPK